MLSRHILKEMHLQHSWLQPARIQKAPTSLIQVQSQSQMVLILHLSQLCSWPSSFSLCLCRLSDSNERGQLAAAFSMNILEWGRSLVEISAELDPAAPTSLKTFVLLVLPPCWHSGTAPAWQTGRESMSLVQEITIPGDFAPNEQWRQCEAFEVCLCFEGPSGFGFVLHGCCLLCSLGCGGCVPSVRPCPGMCPGAGMWLGVGDTKATLLTCCVPAPSRFHVLSPLLCPSALHSQGEGDLLP